MHDAELHPDCRGPWDRGLTNYPKEEHARDCEKCQQWQRDSNCLRIERLRQRAEVHTSGFLYTPSQALKKAAILLAMFVLGYLVGHYLVPLHQPGDYSYLSSEELQDGIEVYRLCMQSASQTGCKMSIDNYTAFRDLKRERAKRAEKRARPKADAQPER